MAGDAVTATVQYYHQGAAGGNNSNFTTTVLGGLLQAISGGNGVANLVKGNAANITTQLSGVSGFINAVQPNGSNPAGNTPQAFLTVIFFDERFNFIPAADGGVEQQQVLASVGSNGSSLTLPPNVKAPKNGYAYIYVSNQSNNDVYFDNLLAQVVQGNIAEENHYYSYGLKIAGLSSKKLGDSYEGQLKNNYLFNEKEFLDDGDLNWYDYGFRNYDPQIGRFVQLDPLTDDFPFYTPYQYAGCEPIANVDLDGLEPLDAVVTAASNLSEVIIKNTPRVVEKAAKSGGFLSKAWRFFKGAADGLVETVKFTVNIFNPDLSKNSLVQTGKFIVNTIQDPVGTFNSIKKMVMETDWSDPYVWGNTLSNLISPGGYIKGFSKLNKIAKGSKAERFITKAEKTLSKVACGCFIAGTLILSDTGHKKIEDIKKGDIVWAYNDTTNAYGKKKVTRVFKYIRDSIYHVQIGKEVISATADHPFFAGGHWLRVAELKVGDSVHTYDGSNLVIEQITLVPGRTAVYNFEVEDYHTYYVTNTKFLVHNNGPGCPTGLQKMKYGSTKALKGKAGVYEHFYQNSAGEIKSYTGQADNLGGKDPGLAEEKDRDKPKKWMKLLNILDPDTLHWTGVELIILIRWKEKCWIQMGVRAMLLL